MIREKIATHDSMTGEPSYWLSIPLIPFAKTQCKNIKDQYFAGCRMFDLRTKYVFDKWRGAHGWWYSKTDIEDTLRWLNEWSNSNDPITVSLTYEGRLKNTEEFKQKALEWKEKYPKLKWGLVAAKYKNDNTLKVEYGHIIEPDKGVEGGIQSFLPLDGKHWQTIIPIPWLWKQFYFKKVEFNTEQYQFVDFL